MAKDKITDYDATAANNLDVGGISVAEGMLPSGVNNAMRELMSHQKEAFGSGTPLYVDQVNNRVGINQATPAHPVHVGTDDLIVDTSGNLLVGKTTSNYTTDGLEFRSDGQIFSSVDGNYTSYLNRKTSDGDILILAKDAATVASIGVASGNAYIDGGAGISGIQFGVGDIRPRYNGALVDGSAADIGHPSNRWQNLYLSGGVYLGGTGSANKLDDYEEGSWTPASSYGTLSFNGGSYTKIGNTVTLRTNVFNFSDTTNSYPVQISGIPFTSATGVTATGAIIGSNIASTKGYNAYIGSNDTVISFYEPPNSGSYEIMRHSDLNSSSDIHVTITYQTNS